MLTRAICGDKNCALSPWELPIENKENFVILRITILISQQKCGDEEQKLLDGHWVQRRNTTKRTATCTLALRVQQRKVHEGAKGI